MLSFPFRFKRRYDKYAMRTDWFTSTCNKNAPQKKKIIISYRKIPYVSRQNQISNFQPFYAYWRRERGLKPGNNNNNINARQPPKYHKKKKKIKPKWKRLSTMQNAFFHLFQNPAHTKTAEEKKEKKVRLHRFLFSHFICYQT